MGLVKKNEEKRKRGKGRGKEREKGRGKEREKGREKGETVKQYQTCFKKISVGTGP